MKTIMITGPSSNSGKTIVTLGLLRAIKNRQIHVSAFKTGPDFIDTRYLELACGKRAGNLDMHLMGRGGIFQSLEMNQGDFALIEGAMGYFDGIYNTFDNSSYDIAKELDTPAVLVYTPGGEMFSIIPKIKGMVDFPHSTIKAVILNKVSKTMYELLKEQIEKYIDVEVLGYLPFNEQLAIESRSLGLKGATEEDHEMLIEQAAQAVEESINIDRLLEMARALEVKAYDYKDKRNITFAVAYDQAFNFYFNENIKLLENIGHIVYFSPLKDERVPACDCIYIGGGYPENYLEELSHNTSMRSSIRQQAQEGKHIIAEAGGLIYLMSAIEGYPMVGVFEGTARMTKRLQRFGYNQIEFKQDTILGKKGTLIAANEYHRSLVDSQEQGVFKVKKARTSENWECGYSYKNTLAYYQHIHFLGNAHCFAYLLDHIEETKEGS